MRYVLHPRVKQREARVTVIDAAMREPRSYVYANMTATRAAVLAFIRYVLNEAPTEENVLRGYAALKADITGAWVYEGKAGDVQPSVVGHWHEGDRTRHHKQRARYVLKAKPVLSDGGGVAYEHWGRKGSLCGKTGEVVSPPLGSKPVPEGAAYMLFKGLREPMFVWLDSVEWS